MRGESVMRDKGGRVRRGEGRDGKVPKEVSGEER